MASYFSKSLFLLLFALSAILLPISSVNAGCSIEVSGSETGLSDYKPLGQSFTATCDGLLHSVTVYALFATTTGVTLSIYSGESVAEVNRLHVQSGITLSGTSTVVLSDSVAMVSGEQYTFLFTDGSRKLSSQSLLGGGAAMTEGRAYLGVDDKPQIINSFVSDYDLLFTVEIADSSTATKIALTGPATVLKDGLGAFTITALDESDEACRCD